MLSSSLSLLSKRAASFNSNSFHYHRHHRVHSHLHTTGANTSVSRNILLATRSSTSFLPPLTPVTRTSVSPLVTMAMAMTRLHLSTKANENEESVLGGSQKEVSPSSLSSIYGGEFAGQSATFSSISGELIPVPEHYVPKSMVEWGQIPSCFEVIVSEEKASSDTDGAEDSAGVAGLNQWTVQVMPEVGCGLDNLDTMKTQKYIPFTSTGATTSTPDNAFALTSPEHGVSVCSVFIPIENWIECIFTNENGENEHESELTKSTRTRVGINLFPNNQQIKSPIDTVKE